jgi:hypothetical protein
MKFEARRAGIDQSERINECRTFGAQPFLFPITTASRPRLFNAGPADLAQNFETPY